MPGCGMGFTSSLPMTTNDINSLELISLYIKHYKTLNNIHVNLNPMFIAKYDGERILNLSDRSDFPRKEPFSNIKLLCGENGVGKTSILELIRNPNLSNGNILIMKTKDDKFISNSKVEIVYNNKKYICGNPDYELRFGELSISQSTLSEEGLEFERCFLDFYMREKKLFDDIDEYLITHFEIKHWSRDDLYALIIDNIRHKLHISHVESYDLDELRKKDLLSYLFYRHFGDRTFDDWINENVTTLDSILDDLDEFNVVNILIEIRKVFCDPPEGSNIIKVINELSSIIEKEYSVAEYEEIHNKFGEINNKFNEYIDEMYKNANVYHWGNEITSLFYFSGYKRIDNEKIYLYNLSNGEFFSIKNRYHLYVKMLQEDSAIILEDEPDLHLHPEWARCFVKNFLDAIIHNRKYLAKRDKIFRDKFYNFIITTHSPLILSDFFNEEVVFLQKKDYQICVNESTGCCFAGNVGDMLVDNFFLSKTIGTYSERKLKEIIKMMDRKNQNQNLSDQEKDYIKFIITRVGDKLLKKLLEDKFIRNVK